MAGFIRAYCQGKLIEWRPSSDGWIAVEKSSGKEACGPTKDSAYMNLVGKKELPHISLITNVDAPRFMRALEVAAKTVRNRALKSDLLQLRAKLSPLLSER